MRCINIDETVLLESGRNLIVHLALFAGFNIAELNPFYNDGGNDDDAAAYFARLWLGRKHINFHYVVHAVGIRRSI